MTIFLIINFNGKENERLIENVSKRKVRNDTSS
jgi:hypothetical protein